MESVKKTLEKYKMIKSGETIGVACSGGEDSISLLHYLNSIKEDLDAEIVGINIDHSIRETSAQDSKFVEDFCRENHIRLYKFKIESLKIAEEKKCGIEEAARIGRYAMFDSLLEKGVVDKIAIAHHQQDQAETILLNIFRGAGLNGAKGMDFVRGKYIRPLLNTNKLEIHSYTLENGIRYVEDESNYDESYSRNYLRHNIMPKLREKLKSIDKNLLDFARICREDDAYILSTMQFDGILREKNLVRIPTSYFLYPHSVVSRMIFKELEYLNATKDIERKHIQIIENMFHEAQNGVKINLKNNLIIFKEYDFITMYVKEERPTFKACAFKLGKCEIVNFGSITVRKTNNFQFQKQAHLIDADKLPEGCEIRTKKEGDVFTRFNCGTKKLKDYFIDAKIPARIRKDIPLICKGNEVFYVIGYEISDKVKIDENTKSAYLISYKSDII